MTSNCRIIAIRRLFICMLIFIHYSLIILLSLEFIMVILSIFSFHFQKTQKKQNTAFTQYTVLVCVEDRYAPTY